MGYVDSNMKNQIDYSSMSPYIEILGQPDKEYFDFIDDTRRRIAINRCLGFIWDYSPSLWDDYTSIDDYFDYVAESVKHNPDILQAISKRASKIRSRLGR